MLLLRRLLLFLALLALPLAAPAQEDSDAGFIARQIENALSSVGRDVRISGFRGALSSTATMTSLTIADAEGVWLRAENLAMNWNRSALLARRIEIREISAESITLLRPPVAEDSAPAPEATPFALPELPVAINIGNIDVGRLTLGAPLLGEEIALTLSGAVALDAGTLNTTLTATRTDGREGAFSLIAAYGEASRTLSLVLSAEEAPGGLIATLAGIPGQPSLRAQIAGTGPIDDYRATLLLATDGATRLTGTLTTTATPDNGRTFGLAAQGDVTALVLPDYRDFFGPLVRLTLDGRIEGDGTLDLSTLSLAARALTLDGAARFSPEGWPLQLALAGQIANTTAAPVTLPFGGGDITVGNVALDIGYDIDAGDAWTADFRIANLATPQATLPNLTLAGGGTLVPRDGDTPGRLSADLTYAATGLTLADAALATALGPDIAGTLRLARAGDGPFEIALLTVEGPGIGVEAEGTIAGPAAGFRTETSVTLRAEDASRFAPLTGLALGGAADVAIVSAIEPFNGIVDLILTGTTRDLRIGQPQADALLAGDGALTIALQRDEQGTRIPTLTVTTPALTANGTATLTSADSTVAFDLTLPDAALILPDLPAGPATLTGTATRTPDGALTLDVDAAATTLTAAIDLARTAPEAGGTLAGSVIADIADLAPFSTLAARPLSGSAELLLSGQAAADLATFDLTAIARTQDLTTGQPQLDALLAGAGSLDARLTRTGPDTLAITDLRVTTDALTATATADLTADSGTADLDLRLTDVAPFLPGLTGPATLTGTATRAATGDTALAFDATLPGATARIDGTLTPDLAFTGTATATAPDLAAFAPLTGQPLTGALTLTATGRTTADLTLDLALTGRTTDLRTGIPQIDPLLAGTGDIALDLTGRYPDALTVTRAAVTTPALSLTGEGTLLNGETIAALTLALPDVAPIAPGFSGPATLTGTYGRDAGGQSVLDARVTAPATTASFTATIRPPEFGNHTTLTLAADITDLAVYRGLTGLPLAGAFSGTVDGTITPGANAFDLTVAARATNLDPGNPTAATLLRGTGTLGARISIGTDARIRVRDLALAFPNITATGEITTTRTGSEARLDARLADLALIAPDFSGPATLTGTGTQDAGGTWRVQADATGPGGTSARIAGTIAPNLTLALTATGSAPLGLANVALDPNRLTGTAAFDLALRGQPALDALSGTVTLQNAALTLPGARTSFPALAGTVTLGAGQARVDITATPEQGGTLALAGSVGLAPPFAAALDITARRIALSDPTLFETSLDARLSVTGPLTGGALIAGSVDIGATELRVPTSPLGFGGALPVVTHVRPSAPVVETLARAGLTTAGTPPDTGTATGSGAFALDITIRAPSRIFVRGRGLDAELGGQITIRGTSAAPIPTGAFRLIRGRLDVLQQRFQLTEGSIDLRGSFVPIIRFVATTTARTGLAVTLTLEGEVTEPTLTVSSIPELPQDEVLAQLLFGRDLSSITPLQAIQLASAIATLAGRGGGGLIEGFRDTIGIDNLDITTDESGNAALQAGIYLSEQVYTEAVVSNEETTINLNFDVSRDVTIRGSVSSEGETALGIYFERDY